MADVCLAFHLHHPLIPANARLTEWGPALDPYDMASTQQEFLGFNDRVLMPLAETIRKALDGQQDTGLGLSVSGAMVEQWERWAVDGLDAWQNVWQQPGVELMPAPWFHTPEILWDRDEWLSQIQIYREEMTVRGATMSPVCRNPAYLFIQYLAWPLQASGVQGCLVDGESFGWGGSPSNRVARIPFHHSFRILCRNSGWSRAIEQLDALRMGASPAGWAKQVARDLAACPESPVVLSIDLRQWMKHPSMAAAAVSFVGLLLEEGLEAGIKWQSPGEAMFGHEATADFSARDWVVLPGYEGVLGNPHTHPLATEVIQTWRAQLVQGGPPRRHLLDVDLLGEMANPYFWSGHSAGYSGQLYGRLMRQFAWTQVHKL